MERVSTYMQQTAMLGDFLKTQRAMLEAQKQVSTGQRINEYSDSPSDLPALIAARAATAKSSEYEANAKTVQSRVELQDFHIGEIASAAGDLRSDVFEALANGDGSTLRAAFESVLQRTSSVLNTEVDGKYIYGGTQQASAPVTVNTLDALTAAPSTASVFQNNNVAQTAQVDTYQTIAYGQLASELGEPLMNVIRQFAAFDDGPTGAIGTDLTEDQKTFLTSLLAPLDSASSGLIGRQAINGIAGKAADDAVDRHVDMQDTLKGMIADIVEVDMAEAITRLNASQTALQASAQTFNAVQSMSLLNFLNF